MLQFGFSIMKNFLWCQKFWYLVVACHFYFKNILKRANMICMCALIFCSSVLG